MQSGPRSRVCMIVCIGLGRSRYERNDGQDDQINCLSILSILTKQRTYLATLANRFEKHLPDLPESDFFRSLFSPRALFLGAK
jgi:hypothetical protein